MTGQTDDALVLMEWAVASRDPLDLALADGHFGDVDQGFDSFELLDRQIR
ncbi:MAG TPA: hypothetical protein VNB94_02630 [Mycobacteriales bacterium]|nr:hypothetical protein [Mycobacteriales bacterium]